ncbi:glycosyltransferase family 4 protein [Winogradskyella sp.]|uniref:glycosyltransferase family 4 protein n=1 Tax=Winogradskyella sp. TaxID=1883156 RepID=UPI0025DE8E75|nr:glycosyltransferase family 4 protein [Winogradskyella sp.]
MVKKANIKTLILVPAQDQFGGVYNFYENLKPHLDEETDYFYVGEPKFRFNNKLIVSIIYVFKFFKILNKRKPQIVVLNTSLNLNAVLRDSIYVLISKLYRKEVIVFWRGWNFNNEKFLKFPYSIISSMLLKSNKAIVLYSEIGNSLKNLGYKKEIYQLTTMVGDLVFNQPEKEKRKETFDLIFLSRVEVYKGIGELLKAFVILKEKHSNFRLIIAGIGSEYNNIVNYVKENNIKDVLFSGYLKGNEKHELLSSGHLYVFPSYSEGMPNAVLEAMANGVPIITTPVGGLNDFFVEDEMGSFIKVKDVNSIVEKVEYLYSNEELRKSISQKNRIYAKEHFTGQVVYNKLNSIINN